MGDERSNVEAWGGKDGGREGEQSFARTTEDEEQFESIEGAGGVPTAAGPANSGGEVMPAAERVFLSSGREAAEQGASKGLQPQPLPQGIELVNSRSGEPTERESGGKLSGGELGGPKIEYFCPPNQQLRSDSWKIMFLHMLPFTTVPHFLVLFCLLWAYRQWGWSSLLFYTTTCVILTFSPPIYSRRFRTAVSDPLYGILERYVSHAQYVVPEKPFPENWSYIFACHPHGRMFYSAIIFAERDAIWRKNILKRGDLFMTAAGMFFYVPFLRNLFYLVGVIPAGKKDITAKLKKKEHVTILVGGVKEVLLGTEDNADAIYLKKRKGFCKLALQEKASVVPVYFFGENQMFMHNSKGFLRFWERVNKHFKVGVPFMRGRYTILPMPFRSGIYFKAGRWL